LLIFIRVATSSVLVIFGLPLVYLCFVLLFSIILLFFVVMVMLGVTTDVHAIFALLSVIRYVVAAASLALGLHLLL
jgi:hypothetical protein